MPRSQHKNTNRNNQGNVPSPEACNPTLRGSEKGNLGEAKDKDFQDIIYKYIPGSLREYE